MYTAPALKIKIASYFLLRVKISARNSVPVSSYSLLKRDVHFVRTHELEQTYNVYNVQVLPRPLIRAKKCPKGHAKEYTSFRGWRAKVRGQEFILPRVNGAPHETYCPLGRSHAGV